MRQKEKSKLHDVLLNIRGKYTDRGDMTCQELGADCGDMIDFVVRVKGGMENQNVTVEEM